MCGTGLRQANTYLPMSTLRVEWSDMMAADVAVCLVCGTGLHWDVGNTRRKEVTLLTAEMRGRASGDQGECLIKSSNI
jgi:hypothetical protein